jgi:hypothetical protein
VVPPSLFRVKPQNHSQTVTWLDDDNSRVISFTHRTGLAPYPGSLGRIPVNDRLFPSYPTRFICITDGDFTNDYMRTKERMSNLSRISAILRGFPNDPIPPNPTFPTALESANENAPGIRKPVFGSLQSPKRFFVIFAMRR